MNKKKLSFTILALFFNAALAMVPSDPLFNQNRLSYSNLNTITPEMYMGRPFTIENIPELYGIRLQEIRTSGQNGDCGYISAGMTRAQCFSTVSAILSSPEHPSYSRMKTCVNNEIALRFEDWIQTPNYNKTFDRLTIEEKKFIVTYTILLKVYNVNRMSSAEFATFITSIEHISNIMSISPYINALAPYSQGEIKTLIRDNLSRIHDPLKYKRCVDGFLNILATERPISADPTGKYFASFEPEGILDELLSINSKTIFILPKERAADPCLFALRVGVAPSTPIDFHSNSIRYIIHNSIESHFSRAICVND